MSRLEIVVGAQDLPLAPAWRIRRDVALELGAAALAAELAALADGREHYWVLEQGPLAPGSLRQSLLNLDSDVALAAALLQTFGHGEAPSSLVFRLLPRQHAAGVLFTRHPLRPDLDHIVVEGRAAGGSHQRLILHADGSIAWQGDDADDLVGIGAVRFHELVRWLEQRHEGPRAAEWVWDGERLWLLQALPIGTLPMPSEVWTRRAGLGFSCQAMSPLWYTMLARWLKEGFWRPLGRRAGWDALGNVEPYRRQHSQLYVNGHFLRALQRWRPALDLRRALPPAWREPDGESEPAALPFWRCLGWRLRLAMLEARLRRTRIDHGGADGLWLALMRLDGIGARLAAVEGWLGYVAAPSCRRRTDLPVALARWQVAMLQDLGRVAQGTLSWDRFQQRHRRASAGDDPVFARFGDVPAGNELMALHEAVMALPSARVARLLTLDPGCPEPAIQLRQRAAFLRRRLGGALREVLRRMAERLVEQGVLGHPDDIHFLYFDELWQAWQGRLDERAAGLLGERKVRFLADAHAGPPDWIIDGVGYGTSALGQTRRSETVRGRSLVAGSCEGRVQRIGSGWQLNQVRAGDVLVLDQSEPGWLPWLATAGALVLAHRDPLDPAAVLACALGIPCLWGVDDAMHCLVDGVHVHVDGATGAVIQID